MKRAHATRALMEQAIRNVAGSAPLRSGKVALELPPLVENGNTVPLTVSVDSSMTPHDYVKAIHIFNEKNPQPHVMHARFGLRTGRPTVATRIRLADSQRVLALAEMGDGSFWATSVDVVVTLAACVEDPR